MRKITKDRPTTLRWYNNTGAAVVPDTLVFIGSFLWGITVGAISAGSYGSVNIADVMTVAKAAGTAWNQGDAIYWNPSTSSASPVQTPGCILLGFSDADVAAAATTGDVVPLMSSAPPIPSMILLADPGDGEALPAESGYLPIVTGADAETRTLANPTGAGQELTIVHETDGGGAAVVTVASAINATGNTAITLADAGDFIVLRSIKVGANYRWRVAANDGAALSTP